MQFNVVDRDNNPVVAIVQSTDPVTDRSGVIAATGASQVLLQANPARSGFLFQNLGVSTLTMLLNELGLDPTQNHSWSIPYGGTFPPPGYPVPTGPVTIAGRIGDAFTCREW